MVRNSKSGLFLYNYIFSYRDYNEEEPWLISFKTLAVEMDQLSFSKQ